MGVKLGRSHLGRKVGLRVFENRVLRRIFGPKRDEVTGKWRKLRNEMICTLFRVIKSRRMVWVGHVARMGERRDVSRVLVGRPEERDHLEDPVLDGSIILRWIFRKRLWRHGLDRAG